MKLFFLKILSLVIGCFVWSFVAFSNNQQLSLAEDSLRIMFGILGDPGKESLHNEINQDIISILNNNLRNPESFDYPFDSLPFLGKITSSDNRIRIYTWNRAISPSEQNYYGFMQVKDIGANENEELSLYFLNHTPAGSEDFVNGVFGTDNWYGALYYQIHPVTVSGETFYTIIGFDFNNMFTNKKLIDVISFNDGAPVFGYPLFQLKVGLQHRVVFEYSAMVVMLLRYFPQADMIVYDHLSPESPGYEGQFRYYGPDFSYDALKFENGRWRYLPDVDWKN